MSVKEVLFLTRILTHYRVPFHERVRAILADSGIIYRLAYSDPTPREAAKGDLASLDWAEKVPARYWGKPEYVWQSLPQGRGFDLIIVGQESKILSNYTLIVTRKLLGRKVAFFGHGKNFQAKNDKSFDELFKKFWIDKVDWWFAYTNRAANIVKESGFPLSNITVFNNSIDTKAIFEEVSSLDPAQVHALRTSKFSGSSNVGIFIGGLYEQKRLPFLIEAAILLRSNVPDFQLVIVGSGVEANVAIAAGESHPWIHYVGPKFGAEKTLLASAAKVMLMPGLVGLGILDAFAYGIPIVTTNIDYHSPEIDYLINNENGVVVDDGDDVAAYAGAVERVLLDDEYRLRLVRGGEKAKGDFTIEMMAERFCEGVKAALAS